jgi:hypothetical protein
VLVDLPTTGWDRWLQSSDVSPNPSEARKGKEGKGRSSDERTSADEEIMMGDGGALSFSHFATNAVAQVPGMVPQLQKKVNN